MKKVGIWFLAFSLFAAHLFFRSVAHADEGSSWQQVYAKSGECRISFPTAPQIVEQTMKISEAGHRLRYDVYLAPFEDQGVFLLLVAQYPVPLTTGHENAGLEGLINGIVGHHPDNELIFANLVSLHGHPGIDFLIQSGKNYFRGHALMVGNRLFLIAMEGAKGKQNEDVFSRFAKSFKLN